MAKEKKVTFSEEIDSSISGFALGVAFVVVGLFVWFGQLLHNRLAESVVTIVLLIIGICGTFFEIEKANHKSIKGLDTIGVGLFFLVPSVFAIYKWNYLEVNIICLFTLLFGVDGLFRGILEVGYSIKIQVRKTENKKVEVFKIITGLTEIVALVVVVLELIREVR